MQTDSHVIVVGSVNADYVLGVSSLPAPGETVLGGRLSRFVGGKGANQAVAARRAGARVDFIGAVGDDEGGRAAIAEFELEGIGVSHLAISQEDATGSAFILVDESGENQIAVASGANHALSAARVRDAMEALDPDERSIVLLSFELQDEPLEEAATAACGRGVRVIINPAPGRMLTPRLLAAGPILTPNRGEAFALLDGPNDGVDHDDLHAQIARLVATTERPVVVTLGQEGALIAELHSDPVALPAFPATAVDTTGAGDAFAGVFAAALAEGLPFASAVTRAMAAAALSVASHGAHTGYPTRTQIDALLERSAAVDGAL